MESHCTLRNMLVHPKDKRDHLNTTDVIYSVPCKNCPVSYIGETGREFDKRLEEHRVEAEKLSTGIKTSATCKSSQSVDHKSAISDHVVDNNRLIDWDEARIIGKESDRYERWIKEAIAIRKQGTTMNRDEGQYQLSHVFNDLLKTSSGNQITNNLKDGSGYSLFSIDKFLFQITLDMKTLYSFIKIVLNMLLQNCERLLLARAWNVWHCDVL